MGQDWQPGTYSTTEANRYKVIHRFSIYPLKTKFIFYAGLSCKEQTVPF